MLKICWSCGGIYSARIGESNSQKGAAVHTLTVARMEPHCEHAFQWKLPNLTLSFFFLGADSNTLSSQRLGNPSWTSSLLKLNVFERNQTRGTTMLINFPLWVSYYFLFIYYYYLIIINCCSAQVLFKCQIRNSNNFDLSLIILYWSIFYFYIRLRTVFRTF